MEKQLFRLLQVSTLFIFLFTLGCGGADGPTNIAENADADAIAEYKAMLAKEEQQRAAGAELSEAAVGPIKE